MVWIPLDLFLLVKSWKMLKTCSARRVFKADSSFFLFSITCFCSYEIFMNPEMINSCSFLLQTSSMFSNPYSAFFRSIGSLMSSTQMVYSLIDQRAFLKNYWIFWNPDANLLFSILPSTANSLFPLPKTIGLFSLTKTTS